MNAFQQILHYVTAPFRFLLQGPAWLIAAPRRMQGLSPPARAAIFMALVLIICTAIVVLTYTFSEVKPHGDVLTDPKWIISVLLVLIITPVTTYYLVRLWLEEDVSRYPDIDRAWEEGIAALAENGMDVRDLPLYVILGIPNEPAAKALFEAAQLPPAILQAPQGPAPLHWHVTEQAIYLVCTATGRQGKLSQLAAAATPVQATPTSASVGGPSGTMVIGPNSGAAPVAEAPAPPSAPSVMGTLMAWDSSALAGTEQKSAPVAANKLSRKEAEEQSDRLEYLLYRLRDERRPYCANNGVLSILPHRVLSDIIFAKDAADAVQSDLTAIRETGQLASAVTVLVSGMEAEDGFVELVHRVGLERAQGSRFGKGFDVWNVASDENLDALSAHACGSFEDWVYTLFASGDSQDRISNGRLYVMMCLVRRHLLPRIRAALVSGFAEEEHDRRLPRLLSGCYFAATGQHPERQAFVRSVFDKLDQLSEDLQWSQAALREEDRYRWATRVFTFVNSILLIVIAVLSYRCLAELFS